MSASQNYDVAIIGAGVGGLTAAALLAKSGLKVALIEKEPHAGGYLAGYQKKGFRFDTAIHWLNQCSPTGFVTKIFRLLGKDHPVFKSHKNIRRYKGDTIDFLLTDQPDSLRDKLIAAFPDNDKGISAFFKASKKLGNSLNNFKDIYRSTETMNWLQKVKHNVAMLKFAIPFIPFIRYTGDNLKKGLRNFFSDERLQRLFSSETDLLSCMVPVGWAYYGDYQHPPEGGGQIIPEWLMHVLKEHGCDVFFNTSVEKINIENERATGLTVVSKGCEKEISARYIIAACDLHSVFESMLPEGFVPEKKIRQLREAEVYASSFTVSIALDCPTEALGFGEEMIHLFKEGISKELHNDGNAEYSALTILAPSVNDKSLAPEGCGTLVVFMPAYMHQHNEWQTEKGLHRGEEYQSLKKKVAEVLIDRVAKSLAPDFRKHILFYDVATPVTHWRYTGNRAGTMMGTKPGRKNMQSKVAGYKTPVKNLFIGGQWAELGGGVPIAAKAGTNAALLVLQQLRPNAFNDLIGYLDGKDSIEELEKRNNLKQRTNHWQRRKTPAEKYFSAKKDT